MQMFVMPAMFTAHRLGAGRRLVDVSIPEIGLELKNGREITVRTPYPNKYWLIVGPKGNPAKDGLLVDVEDAPGRMTVRTRWAVDASAMVVHEIEVVLADRLHDIVAAHSTAWAHRAGGDYRWADVELPWMKGRGTVALDAFMPNDRYDLETVRGAQDTVVDGLVVHRRERMEVPTIERERWEWIAWASTKYSRGSSRSRVPTVPINT